MSLCCWAYLKPARLAREKFCSPGRVGPTQTRLGESLLQYMSMLLCKGHISCSKCYFANPNDQNVKTWVVSLQSKFDGDPMVNEFEIVVLPKQVWEQSRNHSIPTQINKNPHNLTSTPSSCTRIIHTTL